MDEDDLEELLVLLRECEERARAAALVARSGIARAALRSAAWTLERVIAAVDAGAR